ncbi:MAG: DHH family phosphoesterase [Bacillota bacterium]|jgi:phosphoesterase RecJ-like protein
MKKNGNIYGEIIKALDNKNILITGHLAPDADCISSLLAIYLAFGGRKKGWQVLLEDDYPENLCFLPFINIIKKPHEIAGSIDNVLLLDCGDYKRAAAKDWLDPYKEKPLYIIDHHQKLSDHGDVIVHESNAAATAQIVYKIIKEAGINVDKDIALLLYSGIAADTGGFRYSNTSKETLILSAELLDYGVDLEKVRINLFERRSFANMKLLGVALDSLELFYGGQVAMMVVDRSSMLKYQASPTDCANIVNFSLLVENVGIGLFLEEREDEVKVSLRCRDNYTVDDIAASLGGGGHFRAAGCSLKCTLEDAKRTLLQAINCKIAGV